MMRRFLKRGGALLLLFILLLGTGCSSNQDDKTEKTFTSNGFSLSLPSNYSVVNQQGATSSFEGPRVAVTALKEPFALLLEKGITAESSLSDYATAVLQANNMNDVTFESSEEGNYVFCSYPATSDGDEFFVLGVMVKGTDAFWTCNFICRTENRSAYETKFHEWAKSIQID
ncbi:hypothetical protein LJB83_01705 [Clostridia bacterium OttesenSCG-928-F22]|nr:hypothetical protein [Clostridia bacterium OttesenSCG-928-F22]